MDDSSEWERLTSASDESSTSAACVSVASSQAEEQFRVLRVVNVDCAGDSPVDRQSVSGEDLNAVDRQVDDMSDSDEDDYDDLNFLNEPVRPTDDGVSAVHNRMNVVEEQVGESAPSNACFHNNSDEQGIRQIDEATTLHRPPVYTESADDCETRTKGKRLHDTSCELCGEQIRGERWICKECPLWNVCGLCFDLLLSDNDVHPGHLFLHIQGPADAIRIPERFIRRSMPIQRDGRSFYVSHVDADILHEDVVCSNCQESIIGIRYDCAAEECISRGGVVLCARCEALPINSHCQSHPLLKFKAKRVTCDDSWKGFH